MTLIKKTHLYLKRDTVAYKNDMASLKHDIFIIEMWHGLSIISCKSHKNDSYTWKMTLVCIIWCIMLLRK